MLCLKNLRDALFLVLLIAGMVGCSSSNDASPQASEDKSRNVHTFSWLNPGSENFHGVSATSQSPQTCGSCHGLELQGSGNIPGCDNCHFDLKNFNNYSPDGSWTHGTSPHGQFIDQAATCNNCHTTLRQFEGQGPEACHDCHIHPTDGSYLGVAHRRDAKGSAENPEGLAGCQLCHGESGGEGSNASFIYGIQSAGNRGCEGCHNAGSAHPTSFSIFGALETIRWYDAVAGDPASNASSNEGATHNDIGGSQAAKDACFICHALEAGDFTRIGPGCLFCHQTDPALTRKGQCLSCHANPPNGSPALAPNRAGRHQFPTHADQSCHVCHTNNGPDSQDGTIDDPLAYQHFTFPNIQAGFDKRFSRANLLSSPETSPQSMSMIPDLSSENFSCNGSCHEYNHNNASWY